MYPPLTIFSLCIVPIIRYITFTNDEMGFERGFGALASNEINVYWSGNTDQVKGDVYYLNVPITNNLLGTRLFFIPKGTAKDYENIYTLEDLRKSKKVGGFGRGWSDVTIWKNIMLILKNFNLKLIFIERHAGVEPVTFGLGSRRSTN